MKSFDLEGGGRMPAFGLGTWKSEPGEVRAAVQEAIRLGYRHIDCAPIYQNEAEVGQAIGEAIGAGEVTRDSVWITSKLWNSDHARQDVVPALERTLGDLGLDYLDLYLVHWPISQRPGVGFPEGPGDFLSPDESPMTETWEGMEDAVGRGLCRHIGLSNFNTRKIDDVLAGARIPPTVCQVEAHPYLAQNDLLSYCRDHGIVMTAYSPLGSPDRPAFLKQDDEPSLLEDPVILEVAARHDLSAGQVLIAWALQRGTSVIPKSANPARLRENIEASTEELTPEDMAAIAGLDRGYRLIDGSFFCPEGSPYTVADLWGS